MNNNELKEWKKDVYIPETIWKKYEQTLEDIEVLSVERKKIKRKGRFSQTIINQKTKIWVAAAAFLIVFLAGGTIFCYTNPAIASKLPLIGTIFWQVEDQVSFPGVYSDVHILSENDLSKNNLKESENEIMQEKEYSVISNDITITASEIYYDGYSVYLTVKIEDTKGRFKNIYNYESCSIYMWGENESGSSYKIGKEKEVLFSRTNIMLEGKVIDYNTYIGMLKLDRKDYLEEAGEVNLNLDVLSYENNDTKTITELEGEWNLTIPYTINTECSKVIEVNQVNKNQLGVKKVIVTPYQLVVFCEKPDKEWLGCKAFSENKELERNNTQRDEAGIFALNNNTIETLHLYLLYNPGDGFKAINFMQEKGEEKVKEMSDFYIEIPIE